MRIIKVEIHFNDNGQLHTGNVFRNNRIRSRISCDNLSFSLQQNGMVENNNIEGMIAVYMCRDVTVSRNYIQGIPGGRPLYITLPAQDITIDGNEMITVANNHLIKIAEPEPGENTIDWDVFAQRINQQIHIIIKGSRYVTTSEMLIDVGYPFLNELPERPRIVAIFGHALVDGEHVNEHHDIITRRNLEHQPRFIAVGNFVNLLNEVNILTRLNNWLC